MPMKASGKSYHFVSEASQLSGVSRSTIYRWIHAGIITGGRLQNRKGWTLFTQEDIAELKAKAEIVRLESGSEQKSAGFKR